MKGEWVMITAQDGGTFRAYLGKPRTGSGPGIILFQEIFGVNEYIRSIADYFAEEGYVVIAPDLFWRIEPGVEFGYEDADLKAAFAIYDKFDPQLAVRDIAATVSALRALPFCKGKIGGLGFCLGGKLVVMTAAQKLIECGVSYYGVGIEKLTKELGALDIPLVFHCAENDKFVPPEAVKAIRNATESRPGVEIWVYPGADHGFSSPKRANYDRASAAAAHSRTIALFRRVMGPYFNLEELWDAHVGFEFQTRDVDATMDSMVAEPYVYVVPTMTGGFGHEELYHFYKHHFIFQSPDDIHGIPISRTVGADRIVDEHILCFTHNRVMDWILPGVAPTGKYVEIPLIAIVSFRGGKLYNEHIYWDQASVLAQVGLLDPTNLPIVGAECSKKLLNPSMPSNHLIPEWSYDRNRSAG